MKSALDRDRIHRSHEDLRVNNSWRTRQHGLAKRATLVSRAGLALQSAIESVVIRTSVLPDTPVYSLQDFPWVAPVEAEWELIRRELDQLMSRRALMPSFHEIIEEVGTITRDEGWKTFFLVNAGKTFKRNASQCPETMRILGSIPEVVTAFFSILSPGKHIPAHRGAYNGVLRYHLGLQVPEPHALCRIRIADEIYRWQEGKSLIFDDTYNHEIWNQTQGYRVVLFVDFGRPLRQPGRWLNRRILSLAPLAPFLRQAKTRQRQWEKKFYRN